MSSSLNAMSLPVGAPGVGVPGLDPTPEQLDNITTLSAALAFPGIGEGLRNALYEMLGTPTVVRDLAFIPRTTWDKVIGEVKVDGNDINPIDVAKLESFRRVCRLRTGQSPGDPVQPTVSLAPHSAGDPGKPAAIPDGSRNLKLSHIVDPTLDAPLVSLPTAKIRALFEEYAKRQGAKPDRAVEPTQDQISAVAQLLASDHCPYVDFAIFGPYGRRMLERLTYFAFVAQPDGSWMRRELDGPNSFAGWWTSWRVLRTLYLLLDLADPEHLDNYAEHIRALDQRYGRECWFITYTGDKRMRSEQFDCLRREAESDHMADPGRFNYDNRRPWNEVFRRARVDRDFWEENVKESALLFLNRSKTAAAAVDDHTIHPELQSRQRTEQPRVLVQDPSGFGPGAPAAKKSKLGSDTADLSRKDERGKYTHNRKGSMLCTRYQSDSCQSRGMQCSEGAHQCCNCLATHPGNSRRCSASGSGGAHKGGGGHGTKSGGKGGGKSGGKGKRR